MSNAITVIDSATASFELSQRKASALAYSQLVPDAMQIKNPADKVEVQRKQANCLIALQMAEQLNISPLMVMQNIIIVKGTAGWKSQFLIARANASGVFSSSIDYDVVRENNNISVRAKATSAKTGEWIYGPTVDLEMAKAEGWFNSNPKYKSMPEVMLRYRAAAFFVRFHAPEVTLGFYTAEELETIPQPLPKVVSEKKDLRALAQEPVEAMAIEAVVDAVEEPQELAFDEEGEIVS